LAINYPTSLYTGNGLLNTVTFYCTLDLI